MTAPVLARPDRRTAAADAHAGDAGHGGGSPRLRDDLDLSGAGLATARSASASPAIPSAPGSGRKGQAPAHLKVVGRRRLLDIGRRRTRMAVAATVGLLFFVVFGLVGLHVMMEQSQLKLDKLQTQATADEVTYQNLRLQVDLLEAPARIVAAAMGRLGMVWPATLTYLTPANLSGTTAGAKGTTTTRSGRTGKSSATTQGQPAATGADAGATGTKPGGSTVTAPSGSTDWPAIKSELDTNP